MPGGSLRGGAIRKEEQITSDRKEFTRTAVAPLVDAATGCQRVRPQNALRSCPELVIQREPAICSK